MRNYHEEARLDALRQLKLLDTPASESFDRITRMASQIFRLPVAAVSLTDHDRQWFKSRVGVDHSSIPRDKAPCSEVAETTRTLVIEDMQADACYADSPLGQAGTRFYAGAPLVTNDGFGLGALCVLGTEPRRVSESELAALVDLAAMVMAQIELQHAFGRIDPISGLPTRNQFHEDLIDLAREHPDQSRMAVLVDLARDEQISRINRALGGARLNDLIREASHTLQSAVGPDRQVYHVAATQFAFLSPAGVATADYMQLLRTTFERLAVRATSRFVTTAAVGVRPFMLGQVSADDVLRGAAGAAQDARLGDGAVALYSASNETAHRRQYVLLNDFGKALETPGELRLVYQPRIDLATSRCIGAEALLRWNHPTFGPISPAEFIPIIEQTALAKLTTQWVLDTALDQIAAWSEAGLSITVSVNLSAANLAEVDLLERIQLGLLRRRLRPDQLELELTESAIMEQPEQALAMLQELADAGICLAIDDFGTGYSSLAYLQRVPAHVVKIDQAFVRDLEGAEGAEFVLVEAMVDLAHRLGYRVVAEGVEGPEAAAVLRQIGCEEAQGFFYARPMETDGFDRWIATGAQTREAVAVAA